MTKLDKTIQGTIRKSPVKGGSPFVVIPDSADFFGTKGLVKVAGTLEGVEFRTALSSFGDGSHKLPLTPPLLKAIGKKPGEDVTVHLLERL